MVPRKATGQIESREWADGRTVTWRLRISAYGGRHRINLGTNHEGWSQDRAQVELDRILAMVERGTWEPPSTTVVVDEPADDETMRVTISRWWQRKRGELAPTTAADYRWRLNFILAFFEARLTAEIKVRHVDEFRDVLAKQRTQHGHPFSPRSVNMVLDALAQVLDDAVEYELLDQNPARGKRRRMRVAKSSRSFLEPDMVLDLLDAAGRWEAGLPEHQRYGRRSLLALLCLGGGPRISEALSADRGDFDLAAGRWRIPDSKTEAGARDVELPAFLAAELRDHAASMNSLGRPLSPHKPMWMTAKGNRLNPSNVRNRLLRQGVEKANEQREDKMQLPARVTPHTLRRTFASLALAAGRDARWVMAQLGHADPRMTLSVYAQVVTRKNVDADLIWRLMRFPDEHEAGEEAGAAGKMLGPKKARRR